MRLPGRRRTVHAANLGGTGSEAEMSSVWQIIKADESGVQRGVFHLQYQCNVFVYKVLSAAIKYAGSQKCYLISRSTIIWHGNLKFLNISADLLNDNFRKI